MIENGDGGELDISADGDLVLNGTLYNAVYLSLFGGSAFYDEIDIENLEVQSDNIEQELRKPISVDIIMLDNMGLDTMREGVRLINGKAIIEASGNVNLNTVHDIAATGVDIISSSAIVAKAPTLDLGLDM